MAQPEASDSSCYYNVNTVRDDEVELSSAYVKVKEGHTILDDSSPIPYHETAYYQRPRPNRRSSRRWLHRISAQRRHVGYQQQECDNVYEEIGPGTPVSSTEDPESEDQSTQGGCCSKEGLCCKTVWTILLGLAILLTLLSLGLGVASLISHRCRQRKEDCKIGTDSGHYYCQTDYIEWSKKVHGIVVIICIIIIQYSLAYLKHDC